MPVVFFFCSGKALRPFFAVEKGRDFQLSRVRVGDIAMVLRDVYRYPKVKDY